MKPTLVSLTIFATLTITGISQAQDFKQFVQEQKRSGKIAKLLKKRLGDDIRYGEDELLIDTDRMCIVAGRIDCTVDGEDFIGMDWKAHLYIVGGRPTISYVEVAGEELQSNRIDAFQYFQGIKGKKREWKTPNGKYTIEGKYVSKTKDKVKILRSDNNKNIEVEIDKLSDDCKKFIKDFCSGKMTLLHTATVDLIEIKIKLLKKDLKKYQREHNENRKFAKESGSSMTGLSYKGLIDDAKDDLKELRAEKSEILKKYSDKHDEQE